MNMNLNTPAPAMPICRVLFVCLGNICRSPTAEGVFRNAVDSRGLSQRFEIDSAGTSDWHIGTPPDHRACDAAASRGIHLDNLRARQVCAADMKIFDYLIAMNFDNHTNLQCLAGAKYQHKVHLFLALSPTIDREEVPDPYYGEHGFDSVLDLIQQASNELLDYLVAHEVVVT